MKGSQPQPPGALDGFRVVTLAPNVPGPVAAARLRALGAEVVKVEPPAGDPLAHYSPAWYRELAAGQRVVALDLKEPGDRERLDALLAGADLLLTSMRPAALARLSLDRAALHPRYPRLCQVAILGHAPPDAGRAGHDLTYQAAAGLVAPPGLPRTLVADMAAAERTVSAALALLLARERGGEAGYAEVAAADVAEAHAAPLRHGLTAPGGLLGGAHHAYRLYEAADGWIAVAALEPHFLRRLEAELGVPGAGAPELERAFRARTASAWEAWAAERDLPIAAVARVEHGTGRST
jgi:alpha-methylacyl-CoA racemase